MQAQTDTFPTLRPKNPCTEPPKSATTPSNSYQINLISQYLTFNVQSVSEVSKICGKKDEGPAQQIETLKESSVDQDFKTKSTFHNFQKHLINTLKNSIKLKKIRCVEKSRLRIAYELWQYFTSSTRSTKKNLYAILGDNLINNSELIKAPNSETIQLYDLLCRTDEEDVRACQEYLKNAILKQSIKLLKGKLLKGRRMQRSQDFKSYFKNFVEQLEAGTMMRRIPKFKKKNIMEGGLTPTSL